MTKLITLLAKGIHRKVFVSIYFSLTTLGHNYLCFPINYENSKGMYTSYAALPLHLKEENILYFIFFSLTKYFYWFNNFLLPEQVQLWSDYNCQNFSCLSSFFYFCFFLSLCHPSFSSCFIYSFLIFWFEIKMHIGKRK